MRIITVVGARPNFMKAAPLIRAIRQHNSIVGGVQIEHLLVHTGQHYDPIMSGSFFSDLGLDNPDIHLDVGSNSPTNQIAEILQKFEEVLLTHWPEIVIVLGDVNSTVACAMAAAKIPTSSARSRPLIAHVEAGLRSFDRSMPEEVNRIITDHLSDFLFVSEESGLTNLQREGISANKVFFVGNTMIDSLLQFKERADESRILDQLGLRGPSREHGATDVVVPYALLTLHRPSNVDERKPFLEILRGISALSDRMRVVFPAHPRTSKRIEAFGFTDHIRRAGSVPGRGILLSEPVGYIDFLSLMKNARLVLTDSGGVQEETTCLRIPCVTIRENTERPATVTHGTNVIAGVTAGGIHKAIAQAMSRKRNSRSLEKWDGHAGNRIIAVLVKGVQAGNSARGRRRRAKNLVSASSATRSGLLGKGL